MQQFATDLSVTATAVLWIGLLLHFILRRGEPHRELLWATAGIGVAIALYLPPVARAAARIFGSTGPCDLAMNIWGAGSSGLILLAVVAARGRTAILVTLGATGAVMATIALLGQADPSPAGCVTSTDVPATSPFWVLLITWHLGARAAALAACRRDAAELRGDWWARTGVRWYTAGFGISTAYWAVLAVVLVTERGYPPLTTFANQLLFTATAVIFAIAVWWPILHRGIDYLRHTMQFWSLYRELPHHGWTPADRQELWEQSLRGWWRAPERAAYRVRIAHADHHIDQWHHRRGQLQ